MRPALSTLVLHVCVLASASAFVMMPASWSQSGRMEYKSLRCRPRALQHIQLSGGQPAEERYAWTWDGVELACVLTRQGSGLGRRAVLLPSMSSISTRDEMAPLQSILSESFDTVAPDWPGFGTHDKPDVAWTPEAMSAWLDHLLHHVAPGPELIVAAGHAAGYVLKHFASKPQVNAAECPSLVLLAPTWRGPLPTMMRGKRPDWLRNVRAAVDSPLAGPLLYNMNLNELMVSKMTKGHVYSDPAFLTPERMAQKRPVFQAAGARFASVRFVTGGLDPFTAEQDAAAAAAAVPAGKLQLIWGEETPHKSKAMMEALSEASGVVPTVLPRGKLGLHEEFVTQVSQALGVLA